MNDNELNKDSPNHTYRATTNLNTAIENPKININSAVGINIKNVESTDKSSGNFSSDVLSQNSVNSYDDFNRVNNSNQNFIYDMSQSTTTGVNNNVNSSSLNNYPNEDVSNSSNVDGMNLSNMSGSHLVSNSINQEMDTYVPTNQDIKYEPTLEKKKKHTGIVVSKELKIMFFIVFILFIFILLMPYIYDFFKKLQLMLLR